MINAKTAQSKIKTLKAREDMKNEAKWREEKAQFNREKALARKIVLPKVLREIEKQIKAAIKSKETRLYFKFETYWDDEYKHCYGGEHLWEDVNAELNKHGYKVEFDSQTPTTGGDPDSGEGAYVCGPTTYSLEIDWGEEEEKEDEKNEL